MTPEEMNAKYGMPIAPTTPKPVTSFEARWNAKPEVPQEEKGVLGTAVQGLFGGAANLATRPGQLIGVGIAGAASAINGNKEYYDRALASLDKPMKSAIGTDVKPLSQETGKTLAGEALGTVALGVGSPTIAGGMLGASVGLENDGGAGEVALDTIVGAIGGKVFEVGFKAASPFISKAIAKYGTPALEQLQKALPDYAKPYLDDFIKSGNTVIQKDIEKKILSGEKKSMDQALDFVKNKNPTSTELERAANERRVQTNAQGKQEILPTKQQQRQAEAVQPLIDSGELKLNKDGLPTPESVQIIDRKVTQLDTGLKQMVELPRYNEPTTPKKLRAALEATKADHKILFASDPTIEKTYDALIEAFMGNVKSYNAKGILNARQSFDKVPAVQNLLKKFEGVMGGNLKTDAVISIRGGANNFTADLLDIAQSRSVLKAIQPKEAKALITKAKNFANVDDYVRYIKNNKAEYPEITSGTRRKVQATQNTQNQYVTTLDEDLREVWQLSQIMPNPMAGDVFLNTLRTESDLLGAVKSANENYPELYKESNKTFFEKYPWLRSALISGGVLTGGAATGYGVRAATSGQ